MGLALVRCEQGGLFLIHTGNQGLALLQEALALVLGDWISHWHFLAQRIDVHTVDLELIVQVGPGRQAGGADVTDDLALLYRTASLDAFGKALHVPVQRLVAVAVLDDHGVAVTATAPSQFDAAVTGSLDWRTARGGVVDAFVRADLVQDGVLAAGGKARLIRAKSTGVRMKALRRLLPSAV